ADGFFGAMVLIIDPNKPPLIPLEPLKTLFKLTGAELNVAGLLLKGNTLIDVSEIRGVAIVTVKTQAKAVYAKTGVLNRAQLVRKIVSPLRPRLSEQMMRRCAI
ncbi:helix-turn-helix transcriptional regulator, partial [Paracoccaceae bacterium]|nr:helix-turn-helix transcriptional regulator [Paracoccaceae bacterium]